MIALQNSKAHGSSEQRMSALVLVFAPIVVMFSIYHVLLKPFVSSYIGMYISFVILIAPALFYYYSNEKRVLNIFGTKFNLLSSLTNFAFFATVTLPIFYLIIVFIYDGTATFNWQSLLKFSALSFFGKCFFGVVAEEIYFRGFVYDIFDVVFPQKVRLCNITINGAIICSSIAFIFIHDLSITWPPWGYMAFFPGIIFGILRERTGNIFASIMFHLSCNITAFLVTNR